MFNKLADFYKKQQFRVNPISIFINPNYFSRKGLFKYIQKEAPSLKGRLLDFGCGRKPWRSLFHVDEYIGVDIEKSGHDHHDSIVDVFYNGHTLPFEQYSFDSIFASEVCEHLFNIDEILTEFNRVLKPNGHLLITMPFAWNEHEQPYDFARYTSFGITDLLQKHGFEVIRLHKTSTYFETICQLFNSFWIESVFPKNKLIRTILEVIFLGPLNVLFILLNYILPNNKALYLNMVLLAKKM